MALRITRALPVLLAMCFIVSCTATPKPGVGELLEGTLKNDAVAIGGETTGWRLIEPGLVTGRSVEVDVSQVDTQAQRFTGDYVRAVGYWEERDYLERGKSMVFVVTQLDEAADDTTGPEPRR